MEQQSYIVIYLAQSPSDLLGTPLPFYKKDVKKKPVAFNGYYLSVSEKDQLFLKCYSWYVQKMHQKVIQNTYS